jgi:hypothetical protein
MEIPREKLSVVKNATIGHGSSKICIAIPVSDLMLVA